MANSFFKRTTKDDKKKPRKDAFGNDMTQTDSYNRQRQTLINSRTRGFNDAPPGSKDPATYGGAEFASPSTKANIPPKTGITLSGQDIRDQPGGVAGPNDPQTGGGGSSLGGGGGSRRGSGRPLSAKSTAGRPVASPAISGYRSAVKASQDRTRSENKEKLANMKQGAITGSPNPPGMTLTGTTQGTYKPPSQLEQKRDRAIGKLLGQIGSGNMSDFDTKWWANALGLK